MMSRIDNSSMSTHGQGPECSQPTSVVCSCMVFYCFDILYCHLHKLPEPPEPAFTDDAYPLFVTWYTSPPGKIKDLRGCLGNFSPFKLHEGLRKYAFEGAMQDARFSPIEPHELPWLSCSVSLLVNFERAMHFFDWQKDYHGIRVVFFDSGIRYDATFLPEVPSQQGWTQEQTVQELLKKTGYKKLELPPLHEMEITRFQSDKLELTYDDWASMRRGIYT